MIEIKKEGVLLLKTEFGFENAGVLNPATIKVEDKIHMYYRAVGIGNYSSIGYCVFSSPLILEKRSENPVIIPHFDYEKHGVEDPRICQIEGVYYLTYTAYDGMNALGALATSTDLVHFEKKGLIVPQISFKEFSRIISIHEPISEKYNRFNDRGGVTEKFGEKLFVWDKNVIFFPRRIQGKLTFLHRIKPDIQLVAVNELTDLTDDFWQNYFLHFQEFIVLKSKFKHEVSYIGGGCIPIEVAEGWLLIYHGVFDTINGYVYSVCAALLDLENPVKVLSRLPYPLFVPEQEWEKKGYVNNVCFPTGTVILQDTLYVYYGAADEQIACASVSLSGLVQELLLHPEINES